LTFESGAEATAIQTLRVCPTTGTGIIDWQAKIFSVGPFEAGLRSTTGFCNAKNTTSGGVPSTLAI
jgi:hypothetical protein